MLYDVLKGWGAKTLVRCGNQRTIADMVASGLAYHRRPRSCPTSLLAAPVSGLALANGTGIAIAPPPMLVEYAEEVLLISWC